MAADRSSGKPKPSRQQPFGAGDVRRENNLRRLGSRNPACGCGEREPGALTGYHPDIVCYACLLLVQGKLPVEGHHLAGRANSPTKATLPANDHRLLSELQREWPPGTLRNLDGSPLLAAAAALRGWLDVLRLILDRTVGWIPPLLEWLDGELRRLLGERWWENLNPKGEQP